MDSAAQLPAFLCLAAAGAAAGLIYDVLSPLRFSKISAFIADVLFFLLAAVLYVLIATFCRLPDFRLYAYFAMTAGFIIYLKSMRSAVAFFGKMCYNTCVKAQKRLFEPLFRAAAAKFSQKNKKRKSARRKKSEEKSKRTREKIVRAARKKVSL